MSIFSFDSTKDKIGSVFSVDTATIIVKVSELEMLKRMQVNHLIAVKSSKAGQHLIGILIKLPEKQVMTSLKMKNRYLPSRSL